jgi:AcrR family transcriptional regulator
VQTAERRLTEQGRERKQQILDAATHLFASRGYQATRVADICTAAGVAKGLFYWYFETKESLFTELIRSMRQQLRRAQGAAMDPEADPVARLRAGVEASVRFMVDQAAYFSLIESVRTDESMQTVLTEGGEVYAADTQRVIAEAQRAGLIAKDADPHLLTLGVIGAVSHFCQFHRNGKLAMSVDELADFVAAWTARAVGADQRITLGS